MKKWIFGLLLAFFAVAIAPACSKKSGCQATESLKAKTNRKGEYVRSSKKRDVGLFDKKMRKKVGSH